MKITNDTEFYYANNGTGCKHKKHILNPLIKSVTVGICGYNHDYAEIITFNSIPHTDDICKKCLKYYKHMPTKYFIKN